MERENKYYKEYDSGVYSQSNNYYNNFFDMVNHYKDNKQNEIELEKNDNTNIIIANIIGREKFADLYFQIKKDSFEKEIDKVKTKEKEIEL